MSKIVACLVSLTLLVTTHAGAQEALSLTPPVERYELRRNTGLMTAGLIMLGASYTSTAIAAYGTEEYRLAIPLVGPIVYAATELDQSKLGDRTITGLLVMDSMIQTSGLVLAIVGAVTKRPVKLGNRVTLVPSAGGLAGQF